MIKRGDIFGLLALAVCLGGLLLIVVMAPKKEVTVYGPVEVPGSALAVLPDQEAGTAEVLVSATLAKPGFVSVHQAVGDAPADVLGMSSLLAAGDYASLAIPLVTDTEAATHYYVLMFVDDGNGVFEKGKDLPVMVDGTVIKEKLSL